ncbi:glycosyltransferase [Epibacterium ulvae]|uniref:glycosyltransferase family 2 protein n=1 Tax=Epibacterium ulvae TaxID=1156985 RepID=UPI001BFCA6FC|nr:glycosyltransferase [Epibacterium ulvae]MBT8154545.1 glycosyltransferase [Epibacterium ulvae]
MSAQAPHDQDFLAAVVIPHFNDGARLRKCLTALIPQLTPARPVDVIVADNNSTEDISAIITDFPQVRFVTALKKGAAEARNMGVHHSTAPRLFFIDADCIPAPNWLDMALDQTAEDGMIGGTVTVFDETPPPRSGAEAFETVFAFHQQSYIARGFSVTANLLTTRATFDAVGDFNPRVVEDSDWCHRAGALGYGIRFVPELKVAHPTRQNWAALRKKWRRTTSENYFAGGTHAKARLCWGLRAFAVAGSGLLHIPRALRHHALNGPEKRAVVVTLLRLRLVRAGWMLKQAIFDEPPINT